MRHLRFLFTMQRFAAFYGGFAGLGSGLGQGMAAAGSVGAVAEDNDMFARGIIFSALPETQAIYGFLIAILLMVFGGILA